jgi:hypothetical protein
VNLLLEKGADVKSKDGGGQAAIADRKGRAWARGGCEPAAQEGRLILSSFRTYAFLILWWKGGRIQPPEAPFSAAKFTDTSIHSGSAMPRSRVAPATILLRQETVPAECF